MESKLENVVELYAKYHEEIPIAIGDHLRKDPESKIFLIKLTVHRIVSTSSIAYILSQLTGFNVKEVASVSDDASKCIVTLN